MKKLTSQEAYEMYDQMLDEVYGIFEVGETKITASEALKKCDPIGYRVGFADFTDAEEIDVI